MRGHYSPYKNKHANQTAKMLISSLSKTHTSAFTQHYSQAEMSHAKEQKQNKTKRNKTCNDRTCNVFNWGSFLARYLVYCFYDSHLQNNNNNKYFVCHVDEWTSGMKLCGKPLQAGTKHYYSHLTAVSTLRLSCLNIQKTSLLDFINLLLKKKVW